MKVFCKKITKIFANLKYFLYLCAIFARIVRGGLENRGKLPLVNSEGLGYGKNKIYNTMSKICQITGKKAMGGCNVSHSKRHTKRTFDVNLFHRKFYWVEQDCWIQLNVSAAGLRTINKIGLDAALKQAAEKGYLYE